MFEFLIGGIIGVFVAMIGFALILAFGSKIDLAIMTNVIIAFATVIATTIHFDFRKTQKKERVWEINKNVLLELALSLADVIEDLEKATDHYFDVDQGIQYETGSSYSHPAELYQDFSRKTFQLMNAYKPLMTRELLKSFDDFQTSQDNVYNALDSEGLSTFEAYDHSLGHHKTLKKELDQFIKDVSGIEYV